MCKRHHGWLVFTSQVSIFFCFLILPRLTQKLFLMRNFFQAHRLFHNHHKNDNLTIIIRERHCLDGNGGQKCKNTVIVSTLYGSFCWTGRFSCFLFVYTDCIVCVGMVSLKHKFLWSITFYMVFYTMQLLLCKCEFLFIYFFYKSCF